MYFIRRLPKFHKNIRNLSTYLCSKEDAKLKGVREIKIDYEYFHTFYMSQVTKDKYVKEDDVICMAETDKIVIDVRAPISGKLIPHITEHTEFHSNELIASIIPENSDYDIDSYGKSQKNKYLNLINSFDCNTINTENEINNIKTELDDIINNYNNIQISDTIQLEDAKHYYNYTTLLTKYNSNYSIKILEEIKQIFDDKKIISDKFYWIDIGNHIKSMFYYNYGIVQHNMGLYEKAENIYELALKYNEKCPYTLSSLGTIQIIKKNYEKAIEYFSKALEIYPGHAKSNYALAITLIMQNEEKYRKRIGYHLGLAQSFCNSELLSCEIKRRYQDYLELDTKISNSVCNIPILTEYMEPITKNLYDFYLDIYYKKYSNNLSTLLTTALIFHNISENKPKIINQEEKIKELIRKSQKIVVVTGAGISRDLGFLTRQEMWEIHNKDDSVHQYNFMKNPENLWNTVRDFYKRSINFNLNIEVKKTIYDELKRLYKMDKIKGFITQNVEGLHIYSYENIIKGKLENDGIPTNKVIELHGTLNELVCPTCFKIFDVSAIKHLNGDLPKCSSGTILKPNVVLFGERVDEINLKVAKSIITYSDLVLVIGTACDVAPTSNLIEYGLSKKIPIIEINTEKTKLTNYVDYYLHEKDTVNLLKRLF